MTGAPAVQISYENQGCEDHPGVRCRRGEWQRRTDHLEGLGGADHHQLYLRSQHYARNRRRLHIGRVQAPNGVVMTAVDMSHPAKGPLSFPIYCALWIATIISNIGIWMHDVGAGWLMTSLSSSPLLVALVQAATMLPMFLLALPAGAMADIVDRRRMPFTAQMLGLTAAAVLAFLTFRGLTTPRVLLAATFVLGFAAVLSAPVFQAIVPELVDRPTLPDAVALNSLGVNISRAIGPALGGIIVAMVGPSAVFAINAISVLAVVIVLVRAHPKTHLQNARPRPSRYLRLYRGVLQSNPPPQPSRRCQS
ncbi:enterobactin exporter EntS (plasmid) [Hartmannibacter diazotrophicus]|uniref:Enterobactin exporter EntS n=1 Tax=Hartmannibacter diazotrophicus TaxID=1482074 RepID=A0A2C9DEE8_9HYPH|nr:enterobactin exporter EntS [Hartmannibacter diazotrophicus]